LVEFVKNSTNYGLFIVEASIDTDDWLNDHDHIKELDWDLVTEGSDGIYLPYAGQIRQTPNFNINIIDFFQGAGIDVTLGEGYWLFTIQGRYGGTSEANRTTKMENLISLFTDHLRLDQGLLYLGYRKIGEVWEPFKDDNGNTKYYLKGKMLNAEYWRANDQNYYQWKIAHRGVW
jgi:hypothetical protein